ncbi:hypothetical protein N7474_002148 [Penicillium riverlandense]|uniref:uncharacterized protein n=1 Tax=Penicillium riverlandense TaxID=1903569 RepID=UPI002548A98A|nr:uncharacterized protein N7474_002148 [Penicillium riverlandense]KAJ5833837.1 hypothetical protein N7474_002148 [Penicillium riverlandense]
MDKPRRLKTTPPPPSALNVLRPLSENGSFPSSGAIAAKVREQKQIADSKLTAGTTSTVKDPAQKKSDASTAKTRADTGFSMSTPTTSVQRRTETVAQMYDIDEKGGRTWRRLIVEYS